MSAVFNNYLSSFFEKKKNEKRKTEKKNQNELILQTGLNITRKLINIIKIKLCKGMNMLKSTKLY